MNIAGVEIGPGQPCRIVAEMSNAHNGSLDHALRIIEQVADAGADFIKFQCYTPDELVQLRGDGPAPDPWGSDGWTMRDLYEKAQTPHAWFPTLVEKCKEVGLPWFSSVFGLESLILLQNWRCPAYKIAALDVATPFARYIGTLSTPVIASSRGERSLWADLTLYCPPGYPQALFDIHAHPDCDGFSFHGSDWSEVLWAVTGGAQMLECHVQLDDEPSELEANVSLTISQLRQLCSQR